jgi:arginyl-tRNA synthetase
LPIAFKTKSPVQEVAQQIISLSKHNKFLQGKITPGGYINFRLSDEYYYKFIKKITAKRKNPRIKKTVLIEHTSANPTGQLHLGHARIAIIGDTLANIYQFLGFQTVREYYINDRGQQINSLVNSVWYYYCLLYNFFPVESTNLEYQTSTVKNIARFLSKKYSNSLLKNQLDSESFTILRQESLDFLLNKIKKDLKNCRIIFDNWISETELCKNDNLTQLVQTLSSKNLTYFQEEALFLKSSQVGDNKDRVIIKKNGDYTYLLPDTLYHLNKLFRADVLINVFGADHHGHISGVKAALQLHSGCNSVSRIKVVLVQMLSLLTAEGKSQKFSKRLGTAINLDEALKW